MKYIILGGLLCLLNNLEGQKSFHDTWVDPFHICSNEIFIWEQFAETEKLPSNDYAGCIKPFENISKLWIKFQAKNDGDLSFTITPNNQFDDIDFIVFAAKGGLPTDVLRCMSTGLQLDKRFSDQINCSGATGLKYGEIDDLENSGCSEAQNNFLKPLSVNKGDEYIVMITNYQSTEGFAISWGENVTLDPGFCQKDSIGDVSMEITPNPASDVIKCSIQYDMNSTGILYIVSQNGLLIGTLPVSIATDHNEFDIQTSQYPAGKYYLVLSDKEKSISHVAFEIIR